MKLSVSLPDELVAAMDDARGLVTRSAWLAYAMRAVLPSLGQASSVDTRGSSPAGREARLEAADRDPAQPGAASPRGALGLAAPAADSAAAKLGVRPVPKARS